MENQLALFVSQVLIFFILGMMVTIIFYTREFTFRSRPITFPHVKYFKGFKAQLIAFLMLIPVAMFAYVFWIQGLINILYVSAGLALGVWFAIYLNKHPLA